MVVTNVAVFEVASAVVREVTAPVVWSNTIFVCIGLDVVDAEVVGVVTTSAVEEYKTDEAVLVLV